MFQVKSLWFFCRFCQQGTSIKEETNKLKVPGWGIRYHCKCNNEAFHKSNWCCFGERAVQWWKDLPATNVLRVGLWPVSYECWVCCWFSSCSKGFCPGSLVFFAPLKTNISKFQFGQENGTAWKPARADVASFLNIVIYLFILILFMLELEWLGSFCGVLGQDI